MQAQTDAQINAVLAVERFLAEGLSYTDIKERMELTKKKEFHSEYHAILEAVRELEEATCHLCNRPLTSCNADPCATVAKWNYLPHAYESPEDFADPVTGVIYARHNKLMRIASEHKAKTKWPNEEEFLEAMKLMSSMRYGDKMSKEAMAQYTQEWYREAHEREFFCKEEEVNENLREQLRAHIIFNMIRDLP